MMRSLKPLLTAAHYRYLPLPWRAPSAPGASSPPSSSPLAPVPSYTAGAATSGTPNVRGDQSEYWRRATRAQRLGGYHLCPSVLCAVWSERGEHDTGLSQSLSNSFVELGFSRSCLTMTDIHPKYVHDAIMAFNCLPLLELTYMFLHRDV